MNLIHTAPTPILEESDSNCMYIFRVLIKKYRPRIDNSIGNKHEMNNDMFKE